MFVFVYLLLFCDVVSCYLWGWMLTLPGGSEERSTMTKFTLDDVVKLRNLQQQQFYAMGSPCDSDRDCDHSTYCDRHFGLCLPHLDSESACRSDRMCKKGLWCQFGRCQKRIQYGMEGARCRQDADCGRGLCCAKRHGERICQPSLPQGHRCHIPDGGLHYSLNEVCPCAEGLLCTVIAGPDEITTSSTPSPTNNNSSSIETWSPTDFLRCAPIPKFST